MPELFGRRYELQIGGIKIESSLRIEFDIQKTSKPGDNKAEIKVYNLNETHRSICQNSKDIYVRLRAGYQENIHQIFEGWVHYAPSIKSNMDWITVIKAKDGMNPLQSTETTVSFKKGTKYSVILPRLLQDFDGKLKIKTAQSQLSRGNIRTNQTETPKGLAYSGNTAGILNKLMPSMGWEWWVENGEVKVIQIGKHLSERVIVFNKTSGMIEVPEIGEKGIIRLNSLLRGEVLIGQRIKAESGLVHLNKSGFYRTKTVGHTGDSWSGPWKTSIEGTPL